jgi:hypothetical protein
MHYVLRNTSTQSAASLRAAEAEACPTSNLRSHRDYFNKR